MIMIIDYICNELHINQQNGIKREKEKNSPIIYNKSQTTSHVYVVRSRFQFRLFDMYSFRYRFESMRSMRAHNQNRLESNKKSREKNAQ